MKKIVLASLAITGLLLVGTVHTVKAQGYCGGGTWMGYDKDPLVCDEDCFGPGDPYPSCTCTGGDCDTSSVRAAETCSDYTSEGSCTTPGGWECNNGVSCSWQDESTPTPRPTQVPPTMPIPTDEPTVGPNTPTPTSGVCQVGSTDEVKVCDPGEPPCGPTETCYDVTVHYVPKPPCPDDTNRECGTNPNRDHGPVWLQIYSNEAGERYYWKGNDGVDKVSDGPASIVPRDPVTGMFTRIQSYYTGPEAFFSQTLNKTDSLMSVWMEDDRGSAEYWASHFCGAGRAYKPGTSGGAGAFDPYVVNCGSGPFYATCKIDESSCAAGTPYCVQDYDGCTGDFTGGNSCPSGNCRDLGYYDGLRKLLQRINPGPFEGRWTANYWVVESESGNNEFTIELYVRPPGGYKCKAGTFRGAYYKSNGDTTAFNTGYTYDFDSYYTCRANFNPRDDGNLFAVEVEPLPKTENIKTRVILDGTATRVFPLSGGSDFTFTHNGTNPTPSWSTEGLGPYALLNQWADNQALLVTLNHTDPDFDTLVSCDWTWDYVSTPGIDFSGQDKDLTNGCTIDTATVSHPPAIYPVIQSGPASPNENYIEFTLVSELPTPIPDTPTPTSTPTPTQTPTPLPGAGAQTLFCPV